MTTSREVCRDGYQLVLISPEEVALGELAVARTDDDLPLFGPEESEYILRRRLAMERRAASSAQIPSNNRSTRRGVLSSTHHYLSAADGIESVRYPAESRRQSYVARGRR